MSDSGLDIGRRVKARRIADAIRSLDGTAEDARDFSDNEWLMADQLSAKQTGRGGPKRDQPWKPPSEVTRALVIEYLQASTSDCAEDDSAPRDEDVPPVR